MSNSRNNSERVALPGEGAFTQADVIAVAKSDRPVVFVMEQYGTLEGRLAHTALSLQDAEKNVDALRAERDDWMGRAGIAEAKWNQLEAERDALQAWLDARADLLPVEHLTAERDAFQQQLQEVQEDYREVFREMTERGARLGREQAESARLRAALQQLVEKWRASENWGREHLDFNIRNNNIGDEDEYLAYKACADGLAKLLAGDADDAD